MDLWMISLTLIGGALFIYWFSNRHYNYFKDRGIPALNPISTFFDMARVSLKIKSLNDLVEAVYNCDPDAKYVGFYSLTTPIIVLKDPELVKSIAIKNFDNFPNHTMVLDSPAEPLFHKNLISLRDDAWREMRSLLSPAFTSSKMKMMFEIMSPCAENLADYLSTQDPQPDEFDMKDIFGRYSIDVIASSAFGLNVNSMKDRDNEFYQMGREAANFNLLRMIKFYIIKRFPWLADRMALKILSPKTTNFFIEAIENTIATREAQGIVRPDMIQLMMQARNKKDKSILSTEDMTAQAFIFFLGGSDNPPTTMSFVAHLLALNPEVQRKLQIEIDQVLENSSGKVSYEDLHAMKYLDAVVNETLRMYPPVCILDRIGPKSFTLPPALPGGKPAQIEAHQDIWLPCYCFHHDPKYFPEPEKFYPERFSDENKSKINPLTYFPFGLGPRICIANRFALMEMKLGLFHVLAKCNLLPTPKTPPVIKLSKQVFPASPEGGFLLKVEPRS